MRILAPLAVVAFAIACLIAISSQSDDAKVASPTSESSVSSSKSTKTTTDANTGATKVVTRKTYVVKAGDSFSAIAESVGIDVETLQELNPEIDPRALQPGQKLKLKQ